MPSDPTSKCYRNGSGLHPDNSTIFPNVNPYGGIPTNLTINLIGLILLLLMFLILRKNAWRLLNKIIRKDDVERWTHTFFSFTTEIFHKEEDEDEANVVEHISRAIDSSLGPSSYKEDKLPKHSVTFSPVNEENSSNTRQTLVENSLKTHRRCHGKKEMPPANGRCHRQNRRCNR